MDTKIVYQTDHLGIYIGQAEADLSPLEPGVWLIPGGCVEVAPPAVPERKAAYWDSKRWHLIDSYQGLTVYDITSGVPRVIERAGALPAGFTLEVPGPGQIWNGERWVDDVHTVIEQRHREQVVAVNTACMTHITGGFWSAALGDRHFYDTLLEDQLNLTGMILRGLDDSYACRDESGGKHFLEHTSAQLRQIGDEFTEFKLQALRKANGLKQALAAARTALDLDAINAIAWDAAQ